MRLVVFGNRDWTDSRIIRHWLGVIIELPRVSAGITMMHGDAPGADRLAETVAKAMDFAWAFERYPADWQQHGDAAGPIRNAEMARRNPTYGLGFGLLHRNGRQTGTGDMARRLNSSGVPVILVARPR